MALLLEIGDGEIRGNDVMALGAVSFGLYFAMGTVALSLMYAIGWSALAPHYIDANGISESFLRMIREWLLFIA